MPLIRNFTVLVLTMRFMDAIRMFDIVYNLTNGGPGTSTETLASTIYKMAFRYYNVGEGLGRRVYLLRADCAVFPADYEAYRQRRIGEE